MGEPHSEAESKFWGQFTTTHDPIACAEQSACPIHNPSDHAMRDWPLHWRADRGIAERVCMCGVGHPDPDQHPWWEATDRGYDNIHGCCGCCGGMP